MKKLLTILAAFIFSFIIIELFVRYIIKYPSYGVEKKMYGIRADNHAQNIFKPYSKYWNVEGGNQVYKRNNLGLPGTDIHVSDSAKYIFVLGSSFVEALQVPPEKMATSIFAQKLKKNNPSYEVLNLGCSGHDAMDSYLRTLYFAGFFNPQKVILILESDHLGWLKGNQPIKNDTIKIQFVEKNNLLTKLNKLIRNNSSFIEMIFRSIGRNIENKNGEDSKKNMQNIQDEINAIYTKIFNFYKKQFPNKFEIILIGKDYSFNNNITAIAKNLKIRTYSGNICTKENCFNGSGHLNIKGNKELGEMLHEKFF